MPGQPQFPWKKDGHVVTVETPEQIRMEMRVAPFGTRIIGALLDNLILLVIVVVLWLGLILITFTLIMPLLGDDPSGTPTFQRFLDAIRYTWAAFLAAIFIVQTFYFVYLELRYEGQTYGKRILKIRTVMATGQGLTIGGSLIRNLARNVDYFPLLWIVPGLDPSRRRIGSGFRRGAFR